MEKHADAVTANTSFSLAHVWIMPSCRVGMLAAQQATVPHPSLLAIPTGLQIVFVEFGELILICALISLALALTLLAPALAVVEGCDWGRSGKR